MMISNEACDESPTVIQWYLIHENSLTCFLCFFFFFFYDFKHSLAAVKSKVGQVLAMHIQHHQTCYMVLAKINSGNRFSE